MADKKTSTTAAAQPPAELTELVERFALHREAYRSGRYNETQLRREFIDPLFKALGWDVDNTDGYAEAYKDVIHEDSIKVPGMTGGTKAPDYCFRIGGTRKFFLEAKKPSVNIKGDPAPAYQLRRYAWSAKLPLSILTDFEEFAVYDCRVKPEKNDKPSTARVMYFTLEDWPKRWNEVASIYSRDAILRGSFDKYAKSQRKKRGTAEVDDTFLDEIESWREALARNIALRNTVTSRQLNHAVQLTIDRVIFLRISEDRGIEDYGRLRSLLNGERTYPRLFELFEAADNRYNSGLFHFEAEKDRPHPDRLTPGLTIDDKVLKDIIRRLYYPESPYEFSVLSADILGHVYEQFLGKVIEVTASGRRVRIDLKPEVRKAGGVYYTPTYIVDYIVKHTVGELLEGASLKYVGKEKGKAVDEPRFDRTLRVLDPACGSGSFLLGAYQYLLDWHRDWYANNDPKKWAKRKKPPIYQRRENDWRLTVAERKRILLTHIFGVDIDSQAVEVTKLSLLLKVLEGETTQSLGAHLWFAKERALPDLASNIKCGNSLIGPDYWQGKQQGMFDEEERYRINAFDWKAEFQEVFKESGGFDAVIGNPPYVKEYTNRVPFEQVRMTSAEKYYEGKMDLWYIFTCVALDLLRVGGLHSFIATNNWNTSAGATILRRKLTSEADLLTFVDFGSHRVFRDAGIQTAIFVVGKTGKSNKAETSYFRVNDVEADITDLDDWLSRSNETGTVRHSVKLRGPIDKPFTFTGAETGEVLDRIEKVGSFRIAKSEMTQGIVCPQDSVARQHLDKIKGARIGDGIFILSNQEVEELGLEANERAVMRPYFTTAELHRYGGSSTNAHQVIYLGSDANGEIRELPNIKRHLDRYAVVITSHYGPYGLHRARDERFFREPAIVSLRKTRQPHFTYTDFPCYVSQTFNVIKTDRIDMMFLAGILNSRVSWFWFEKRGKKQGDLLQIDSGPLREVPIVGDVTSDQSKGLIGMVQRMLELHKKLPGVKTSHERQVVEREISATDREIDKHVYELYGLTEEEIRIVKEATK